VWAQLVFVSSRWLNLLKRYWFAVSWHFKPTREAMMETTNNPHLKISITQQGQPAQDIERVEVSEGLQTLGA
jgi:hypothetical protein